MIRVSSYKAHDCIIQYLAYIGEKIVGKAILYDEDVWILGHLFVEKPHRNKGIGTNIVQRIMEDAKGHNRRVWVHAVPLEEKNPKRLIKFYKKFGFHIYDYPNDEPYPVMEASIGGK